MTDQPAVYLKLDCPFCLKLRIYLTEAGIADRVRFVVFEDGDETHRALRQRMKDAGQEPSFPAAELSPGTLSTGSDDLIAHFAGEGAAAPDTLPLLQYYEAGVFRKYTDMFKKLKALKG